MLMRSVTTVVAILLGGCQQSGPPNAHTTSSNISTLKERVEVLQKYVTFRRTYETLDFDIMYQNNSGGMVPGPSDWDVRLVATVPQSELQTWIPLGVQPSAQDRRWLETVPKSLDLGGITEWYGDGDRIIGLDRVRRIVAYRAWSS